MKEKENSLPKTRHPRQQRHALHPHLCSRLLNHPLRQPPPLECPTRTTLNPSPYPPPPFNHSITTRTSSSIAPSPVSNTIRTYPTR